MTEINTIYKCKNCGQLVEVVHAGTGELVCCGVPMEKQMAGTSDGAAEKHVPVIEKIEGGYLVKVGSVPHPMVEAHYIQWICLGTKNGGQFHFFVPGDTPEAVFEITEGDAPVAAYEYCNLHGLWKADI